MDFNQSEKKISLKRDKRGKGYHDGTCALAIKKTEFLKGTILTFFNIAFIGFK